MEPSRTYPPPLFAWVAPDADGVEGIIMVPSARGIAPLVGNQISVLRQMRPYAQEAARARSTVARLVRYEVSGFLDEVRGQQ